jgi:hypothetical protein
MGFIGGQITSNDTFSVLGRVEGPTSLSQMKRFVHD